MNNEPIKPMDLPFRERMAEEAKDDRAVVALDVIGPYSLHLTFDDGKQATINFEPALRQIYTGRMYAPLLDPDYFAQVQIDRNGILTWPNGMDFKRAYIYDWAKWIEPVLAEIAAATPPSAVTTD